MNNIELLARTQMALALTNPWKYILSMNAYQCIHCGGTVSKETRDSKLSELLHTEKCIWIIALRATGDYDNE